METLHKKGITQDNIKFFLLIMSIVIGVIVPAITYRSDVDKLTDYVKEIKVERKEAWAGQLTINERQQATVSELDKLLVELKTRVDYIEK